MKKYEGKIYKLVNDTMGLTYYGSTIRALYQRLNQHKSPSNPCKSKILFLGKGEVKIFLLEEYITNDISILKARERYYIENNDCVNKQIPGRTMKEYYQLNKDKIKDYQNKYYIDNKKKLLEQCSEYYEKNKDHLIQYGRNHYEKNKIKIAESRKIKITCRCGSTYRKADRIRHENTMKHYLFIKAQ